MFVERLQLPNLHNRYFAFPSQTLACVLNGHIVLTTFLPIGGDEEDFLINYDLAIVNFVPGDRLRKLILDANVPGVLEGLAKWDYSLKTDGEAARPLHAEDVSLCDAVPL